MSYKLQFYVKKVQVTQFLKSTRWEIFNPLSTNVPFTDKPGSWFLPAKMFEKYLWKSGILSKDACHRPASLLKISLFQKGFSNILLVKTNYLVSTLVEQ